jgi:hypothetical protein
MTPELTEDTIAEAMARTEKVACRPGDDRCYFFPDPLADGRASGTPTGRREAETTWLRLAWTGSPSDEAAA